MSREKCWQCQAASPGAPGSWGGKTIPALPLPLPPDTALSWGPAAASGGMIRASLHPLWSCGAMTLPSLPSSPLPPMPFPHGSCGLAAAQVSIRYCRLPDPAATPPPQPALGSPGEGSCLQPGGSGAGAVLPAVSPGTSPAQTPLTCQDICPLHLLCAAKPPQLLPGHGQGSPRLRNGLWVTWQPKRWGDLSDTATRQPLIETQKKFFEGSKMSGQRRNSSRFESTDALVRADECWLVKPPHFSPGLPLKFAKSLFSICVGRRRRAIKLQLLHQSRILSSLLFPQK